MIQVNEPLISQKAQRYVLNCLKTGWISSSGKYLNLFESSFAKYIGTKYAITTTSGTSALHLALASLDISQGDEVIMPDLTIISCPLAVLYLGAKPVFVDVEEKNATINPYLIESKITKKTKAIMPVHLYGNPSNMNSIIEISKKYKLKIIEDAAEALGCEYNNKKVGGIGDVGCFSFYANKLITTGEGGMVVTNNKRIFNKLRLLKNLAHSSKRRFLHEIVGFNYRMTNLQAALGLGQLESISRFIKKKKQITNSYDKKFRNNIYINTQDKIPNTEQVCWMYTLVLSDKTTISKKNIQAKLKNLGIDTREFFIPLHKQPVLQKLGIVNKNEAFPVSERLSKRGFYIPSGLALTTMQIALVAKTINSLTMYDKTK